MEKKIRNIFVVLFVLFSVFLSYAEQEKELENKHREIQSIESQIGVKGGQLSAINIKIIELDNQILKMEEKIAQTNRELEKAKAKIQWNQKKIDRKEKEIGVLNTALKNRMRVMSKVNTMDYLQLILSSKDMKDFFSKYTVIKNIIRQDKNHVHQLGERKKELIEISTSLNAVKEELLALKKQYDLQTESLYSAKKEQEKALETVKNDIYALQEMENLKIAEAEKVGSFIKKETGATGPYQGKYTGGKLLFPISGGVITSPYGPRMHPILKKNLFHTGLDIGAAAGTPIMAAESGKVMYAGPMSTYGKVVLIDHGLGISTLYAHCSATYVVAGQTVSKGQSIAGVGSTGRSTGPHLHFEVRINGVHTNPMLYL